MLTCLFHGKFGLCCQYVKSDSWEVCLGDGAIAHISMDWKKTCLKFRKTAASLYGSKMCQSQSTRLKFRDYSPCLELPMSQWVIHPWCGPFWVWVFGSESNPRSSEKNKHTHKTELQGHTQKTNFDSSLFVSFFIFWGKTPETQNWVSKLLTYVTWVCPSHKKCIFVTRPWVLVHLQYGPRQSNGLTWCKATSCIS